MPAPRPRVAWRTCTIFRGKRMEKNGPCPPSAFRRCVALCSALALPFPAPGVPWSPPNPKPQTNPDFRFDFFRSHPKHKGDFFSTKRRNPNGDPSPTIGIVHFTFHLAEIETTSANSCWSTLHPLPTSQVPRFPTVAASPNTTQNLPSSTTGLATTASDTRPKDHLPRYSRC